jgi:hypothetical protein
MDADSEFVGLFERSGFNGWVSDGEPGARNCIF